MLSFSFFFWYNQHTTINTANSNSGTITEGCTMTTQTMVTMATMVTKSQQTKTMLFKPTEGPILMAPQCS